MRFEKQEDGYLDTITGLKWSKENFGPMTWDDAMKSPTGWRLPTLEELLSIVNSKKIGPATELLGMKPSYYWSSTTLALYGDGAWEVHFGSGYGYNTDKSRAYYARYIKEV